MHMVQLLSKAAVVFLTSESLVLLNSVLVIIV